MNRREVPFVSRREQPSDLHEHDHRPPDSGEAPTAFAEGALPTADSGERFEAPAQCTMSDCDWLQSPSPDFVTARYLICTVAPGVRPAIDVLD